MHAWMLSGQEYGTLVISIEMGVESKSACDPDEALFVQSESVAGQFMLWGKSAVFGQHLNLIRVAFLLNYVDETKLSIAI